MFFVHKRFYTIYKFVYGFRSWILLDGTPKVSVCCIKVPYLRSFLGNGVPASDPRRDHRTSQDRFRLNDESLDGLDYRLSLLSFVTRRLLPMEIHMNVYTLPSHRTVHVCCIDVTKGRPPFPLKSSLSKLERPTRELTLLQIPLITHSFKFHLLLNDLPPNRYITSLLVFRFLLVS